MSAQEPCSDIGITKVFVVRVTKPLDRFACSRIPADDLLGFISYNPDVIERSQSDFSPRLQFFALEEIRAIKARIDQE